MYESKVKYYYGTGRRKHSVAREFVCTRAMAQSPSTAEALMTTLVWIL